MNDDDKAELLVWALVFVATTALAGSIVYQMWS